MKRPRVLLATTCRWFTTARLAVAFAECGCEVDLVSPGHHPAAITKSVRQSYPYHGLAPSHSFRAAIEASGPEMVLPCDDLAASHLRRLIDPRHAEKRGWIGDLIDRSLGDASSYPVVETRNSFLTLARQANIRVPETSRIANHEELRFWLRANGFPAVLKSDGTWGGVGVRIVHSFEEAERAFQVLSAPPSWARAAKRAAINRDMSLLMPAMTRERRVVNVQKYIAGRDASSSVACWQGKVLASVNFEVMAKARDTGPSCVVHLIDHPDIAAAVEKMAKRLGLSGLLGFDFVLEENTGDAYLIEINPRATQTCHLALGAQHDLTAAMAAALTGQTVEEREAVTGNETIALFPQEWARDPESEFLEMAYHDVPWSEPALIKACMRVSTSNGKWKLQDSLLDIFSKVGQRTGSKAGARH